jgi:hypothetical protein
VSGIYICINWASPEAVEHRFITGSRSTRIVIKAEAKTSGYLDRLVRETREMELNLGNVNSKGSNSVERGIPAPVY